MLMYQDAQKEKMKEIDMQSWLTGRYVLNAIGVAFSEKKKSVKYPEQPITMEKKQNQLEDFANLPEEEQEKVFYETFRQKLRDWNNGIKEKQ